MRYSFLVFLLFVLSLLLNQCKQSGQNAVTIFSDTTFNVINNKCQTDTSQTYCIALPPDYSVSNQYPVVFVFDPHGNGNLAVRTFISGATDFGYIVVGSNVIRNGYATIEYALKALTGDVINHYAVDKGRFYAAGFSGGGRVAQAFSRLNADVKAVVSAGAGYSLPRYKIPGNKAPMLFIVGDEDFNFLEIMNSQNDLTAAGFHYYILEYNGKHAWPTREIIHEALRWFEFDAYRRDPKLKQEPVIKSYLTGIRQRAEQLEKQYDFTGAGREYEKGIAFLSGIANTNSLKKKLKTLKQSRIYRHSILQKNQAISLETRLQQGYISALREKDTLWWRNEIKGLNKKISQSDDNSLKPLYKRIKNFVSMAAYSFCSNALTQDDLVIAASYIAIYQIIDPGNPDGYYFKALLVSKRGQINEAVQYYKKAVELGFNDFKKAQQDLPEEVYTCAIAK
jgi:predicted esterase